MVFCLFHLIIFMLISQFSDKCHDNSGKCLRSYSSWIMLCCLDLISFLSLKVSKPVAFHTVTVIHKGGDKLITKVQFSQEEMVKSCFQDDGRCVPRRKDKKNTQDSVMERTLTKCALIC